MKTLLIVNTRKRRCAIHQYGVNFFAALATYSDMRVIYIEPEDARDLLESQRTMEPDAVIYNWHPTQGGWLAHSPYHLRRGTKHVTIFHEIDFDTSRFHAVIFSAPHLPENDKWFRIPLNLPDWKDKLPPRAGDRIFGTNGFGGAYADRVVDQVMKEFDRGIIRLLIAPADYGDEDGQTAKKMADWCANLMEVKPNLHLVVKNDWLEQSDLLHLLSEHSMNCYLRPVIPKWTGVSAAMCSALAVRRPMAITRSQCFRHLWHVKPSICIEDRSLKEILASGFEPLEPIYRDNTPQKLADHVCHILKKIGV